jgi:hypothetical protein
MIHDRDTENYEVLIFKYATHHSFSPIHTTSQIPNFGQRQVMYQKMKHMVAGYPLTVEFSFIKQHVYLTCVHNQQFQTIELWKK